MVIFHSYVKLPEGILSTFTSATRDLWFILVLLRLGRKLHSPANVPHFFE